jgi:hypothetical protein
MIRVAAPLLAAALLAASAPPASTAPATPGGTAPPSGAPGHATPAATAPASSPAQLISGRPPERPLQRVEPRLWDAKFEASIWVPSNRDGQTTTLQLQSTVVWFPLIMQSTYSQCDPSSSKAELWVQGARVPKLADRLVFRQGGPFGLSMIGIPIGDMAGQSVKWNVTWRVQCWSSKVDEAAAARVTWPETWPAEVQPCLAPQPGIESDSPDFKAFVDKVSKGNLRGVTPWIAAKELVRGTINTFRSMDNDGLQQESGFTRGIILNGAWKAMNTAGGTSHDMAAACVAVLRAAGIPARIVLGIADLPTSGGGNNRARLVTWCEFYLPTAGWVPFDPVTLRGSSRGGLNVERPWPTFGTWDDLNLRVPISYAWTAPVAGAGSLPYPAGWSATGTTRMSSNSSADQVGVQLVSRGRVKE